MPFPKLIAILLVSALSFSLLTSCTGSSAGKPGDTDAVYGRNEKAFYNTSGPNSTNVLVISSSGQNAKIIRIINGVVISTSSIDPSLLGFSADGSVVFIAGQPGLYELSSVPAESVIAGVVPPPKASVETFCNGISATGYSEFEVLLQNTLLEFVALSGSSQSPIGGTGAIAKSVTATSVSYQKAGFGTLQINELFASPKDTTFFKASFLNAPTPWQGVTDMFCHLNNVTIAPSQPDHLEILSGNNQVQNSNTSLAVKPKVRVLDVYGVPVPGVTLFFSKSFGDFQFSSPLQITNSLGEAEVGIQLGYLSGTAQFVVTQSGAALPDMAGSGNGWLTMNFSIKGLGNGTFQFSPETGADGGQPNDIITADFNGDGIDDLLVMNQSIGKFNIHLGRGDGNFTVLQANALYGVNKAAVGDFNGDGKLDIAVTTNNNVTIYLGKGDGSFQNPKSFSTGLGTNNWGVTAGDFNGDGILDLAVASMGSFRVTILLGNGDGTFKSPTYIPAGGSLNGPSNIVVGDFNHDGKLDFIALVPIEAYVSICLGNGDGSFKPPTNIPLSGYDPKAIAVGDFNGDGILDFAITDGSANAVNVLLGNGDGSFQAALTLPTGSPISVISAADFNGDGKMDIAVLEPYLHRVGVFLGKGDGTFGAESFFGVSNRLGISGLGIGDFNGDGKTDIAVSMQVTINILLGL